MVDAARMRSRLAAVFGPVEAPPCIRHRPFRIGRFRHGAPLRVLAPHVVDATSAASAACDRFWTARASATALCMGFVLRSVLMPVRAPAANDVFHPIPKPSDNPIRISPHAPRRAESGGDGCHAIFSTRAMASGRFATKRGLTSPACRTSPERPPSYFKASALPKCSKGDHEFSSFGCAAMMEPSSIAGRPSSTSSEPSRHHLILFCRNPQG